MKKKITLYPIIRDFYFLLSSCRSENEALTLNIKT
jgi:hypothetical protein